MVKTKPNQQPVEQFLDSVEYPRRREDAFTLLRIMNEVTGEAPRMWGSSIIGYGDYHYKYESGREGDWFRTGFSPRKQNLSVYIMPGFKGYDELMTDLGKHKTGKSCLYINKLEDVDMEVLRELIRRSYDHFDQ